MAGKVSEQNTLTIGNRVLPWWCHQWKPFPRYWPFVRGIHRSPVNSPHKSQWRGALMFFFDLRPNKRSGKQSWGWWFETPSRSLWRHCYDACSYPSTIVTSETIRHVNVTHAEVHGAKQLGASGVENFLKHKNYRVLWLKTGLIRVATYADFNKELHKHNKRGNIKKR